MDSTHKPQGVVTLADLEREIAAERERQASLEETVRREGRVWDWLLMRWIERQPCDK